MLYEYMERLMYGFFEIYNGIGNIVYYFYVNNSRLILDYMHAGFKYSFNVFLYLTVVLATFYLLMGISVIFKKKQKEVPFKGTLPKVTVQIPTYNELAALNCAKRCLAFDYPMNKLQIIIGDDSNKPEISEKIDEFAAQHKNVEVTRRGKNIGFKPGNLNHMLKYTKGEFIIIFDSDFLPGTDFVKRIIAPFQDKNVAVVQSRWRIGNFSQNIISVLGGTISIVFHSTAMEFINRIKGNGFLCGSGEAIRKKDLVAVGGWQAGSLTEDIECSLRLIAKGKRLVYLENLEVVCEAPHKIMDLCKQQMRWAFGVVSAVKQHAKEIISSRHANTRDKTSVFIFASGYLFSFLLLGITFFGILSLISDRPAAIDWGRLLSETSFNIALTSGFMVTSAISLARNKKILALPKMLAASLSIGLAVTYYVNIGIIKAFFDRQMQWFMLNKNGNKVLE